MACGGGMEPCEPELENIRVARGAMQPQKRMAV